MSELKKEIKKFAEIKKCEDILAIPLPEDHVCETMILATCTSSRHVKSVANAIYSEYKKNHEVRVDGDEGSGWIVVEVDNILIHLFKSDIRALYNIEELWHADPNHHNGK